MTVYQLMKTGSFKNNKLKINLTLMKKRYISVTDADVSQ